MQSQDKKMGSARAPACCARRPRRAAGQRCGATHRCHETQIFGEGAENNTRGRVRYPFFRPANPRQSARSRGSFPSAAKRLSGRFALPFPASIAATTLHLSRAKTTARDQGSFLSPALFLPYESKRRHPTRRETCLQTIAGFL